MKRQPGNTLRSPIGIGLLLLCLFSFQGQSSQPQLNLGIFERRNAATYKSWKAIKNGAKLHYKKFIKAEYHPDGHRYIMYRFDLAGMPNPSSPYTLEIISLKGNDTLFVHREVNWQNNSTYTFREKMYQVERQLITVRVSAKVKFTFTVFFDIKDFVGDE